MLVIRSGRLIGVLSPVSQLTHFHISLKRLFIFNNGCMQYDHQGTLRGMIESHWLGVKGGT